MKRLVLKVGDKVMTKWDDSNRPLAAVIERKYQGHRRMAYVVRMKDGSVEKIGPDQIV